MERYNKAGVDGRHVTTDPSCRKQKDEEGVKVLHTKSQAGRTQKSGPPATRLECHPLRCTVKLHTACGKTENKKGGRTRRREETEHSYKVLENSRPEG